MENFGPYRLYTFEGGRNVVATSLDSAEIQRPLVRFLRIEAITKLPMQTTIIELDQSFIIRGPGIWGHGRYKK